MKKSVACLSCGTKPLPEGKRKFCSTRCLNWWSNRKGERTPTRERQIVWAAGFVDGEGCVSINRLKSGSLVLVLTVVQTKTEVPTNLLRELFGGSTSVRPGKGNKALAYAWTVSGIAAANALHQMAPYMLVKGEQAKIAQEWAKVGWVGAGRKITPLQKDVREALSQRLKVLNLKGPQSAS